MLTDRALRRFQLLLGVLLVLAIAAKMVGSRDCIPRDLQRWDTLSYLLVAVLMAGLLIFASRGTGRLHQLAGVAGCAGMLAWSVQPMYLGWPLLAIPLGAIGLTRLPRSALALTVGVALLAVALVIAVPVVAQRLVPAELLVCV